MLPQDYFELDDARRREYLVRLIACGGLGLLHCGVADAAWFGSSSKKLADGKSIYSLEGEVLVNDRRADPGTRIRTGDSVRTGANSGVIFAVGGDSFLLRSNSEMEIEGANFFISGLRMLAGGLLSVFAPRKSGQQLSMRATTATIGIRGTGVYMEVEPDLTYLCTCYGRVSLAALDDPDDREMISTTNHDMPRYIARNSSEGTRIRQAPVINHDDEELELLEAIVGRKVPTGFGKKSYQK